MDSLFQSPPIVESIFKHLNARDLCICAQVCNLWNSMSVVELKQRREIDYFFQTAKSNHTTAPEHDGIECNFGKEFKKKLNSLRIKPSFCIAFASESLVDDLEYLFPSLLLDAPLNKRRRTGRWAYPRQSDRLSLKPILASHLPPQSKYMFAVASGIVGCASTNKSIEVEDGYTITGFCFPDIPGVEFHSYDYFENNMEDILKKEQKAKCLLVFSSFQSTVQSKLNMIINERIKSNPNLAVGGAILRNLDKIVAINGENVEAASLIIKKQDDKKEIKNKLKLFGETNLTKHKCFAFMFACVARGFDFHQEQDFESSTFHSLYPKVPLIGLFGEGEIGINFLPSKGTTSSRKFPDRKKHFYSYSTVFVLVSIKD